MTSSLHPASSSFVRLVTILCLATLAPAASAQMFERPGPADKPTVVHMTAVALDVDAIDSAQQSFVMNLFFTARWHDERLAHEGPGNLVLDISEAWAPEFQITNRQRVTRTFPEEIVVDPSGEVRYRQRVWGSFSQPLHLAEFPFDQQEFQVTIVAVSSGSSVEDIQIVTDDLFPSGIAPGFSLPDWDIVDWRAEPSYYDPLGTGRKTPGLTLSFTADRYFGYYMLKLIMPLLLIVMMSWIVFWIDPIEMGTQISVAITSMLTVIAYRFMAGSSLPAISYLTRLDLFILSTTLLVFTTLIEAVVTGTLARRGHEKLARRIDLAARVLYPSAIALIGYLTLLS